MRKSSGFFSSKNRTLAVSLCLAGLFTIMAPVITYAADYEGERGFVRVAPNGRYFEFENGEPFFPVSIMGHDMIERTKQDYPKGLEPLDWDAYFRHMKANGINLLRVMLDGGAYPLDGHNKDYPVPDCGSFPACVMDGACANPQDPTLPGYEPEYNVAVEETLRHLFDLADKYDVYLQINPYFTANMVLIPPFVPANHPYSSLAGGPLQWLLDVAWVSAFYTNEKAKCLTMRRYKWLAENFGEEKHLFSWEIANEMQIGVLGCPLEYINVWIADMLPYMRSVDPNHLVTISTTNAWADESNELPAVVNWARENLAVWNPQLGQDDLLDIVSYHVGYDATDRTAGYFKDAVVNGKVDAIRTVLLAHSALREQVIPALSPPRPVMANEVVPFNRTERDKGDLYEGWTDEMAADYFRMARWAHLAGGSASTSNPFVGGAVDGDLEDREGSPGWVNYYHDEYESYRVISQFTRAIDDYLAAPGFSGRSAAHVIACDDLYVMATGDSASDGDPASVVFAWLLNDTGTGLPPEVTIRFSNLADGDHQVVFYNDRTGKVEGAHVGSGSAFDVTVPRDWFGPTETEGGWQHMALFLRPHESDGYTDIFPEQADTDRDGWIDFLDNCPNHANADQTADADNDGVGNECDNCRDIYNRLQADYDGDGLGDACEECPFGGDGLGAFYVDGYNGLNSNSGRAGAPWRSVTYAQVRTCDSATINVLTCGNDQLDPGEVCDGSSCGANKECKGCTVCESVSPPPVSCAQVPRGAGFVVGDDGVHASAARAFASYLPLFCIGLVTMTLKRVFRQDRK